MNPDRIGESISFEVPGRPVPWQRAGRGRNGQSYTEPESLAYQGVVRLCGLRAVAVHNAEAILNWNKSLRYAVIVRAYFPDRRVRDLDNVMKNVCDGLKHAAYVDDSHVDRKEIERWISRSNPRTLITVVVRDEPPEE